MIRALSLLLLAISCISIQSTDKIITRESYNAVKEKATFEIYTPEENPFNHLTFESAEKFLGLRLPSEEERAKMKYKPFNPSETLPTSFDSRTAFPGCVGPVKNQQQCGSCWAFSGTSTLADRFCIASAGRIKVDLSPQDLVSCDGGNNACHGGLLDRTWTFLEQVGAITEQCWPYESASGQYVPPCQCGYCKNTVNRYNKYRAVQNKSFPLRYYQEIMNDIYSNGSVQTGFIIYEDFMHYKGGVYRYSYGRQTGGHAVKIIGWGRDNVGPYWIVQNSWGPNWGENGFFRIAFGQCGIDQNAYSGLANVQEQQVSCPANDLFLK